MAQTAVLVYTFEPTLQRQGWEDVLRFEAYLGCTVRYRMRLHLQKAMNEC